MEAVHQLLQCRVLHKSKRQSSRHRQSCPRVHKPVPVGGWALLSSTPRQHTGSCNHRPRPTRSIVIVGCVVTPLVIAMDNHLGRRGHDRNPLCARRVLRSAHPVGCRRHKHIGHVVESIWVFGDEVLLKWGARLSTHAILHLHPLQHTESTHDLGPGCVVRLQLFRPNTSNRNRHPVLVLHAHDRIRTQDHQPQRGLAQDSPLRPVGRALLLLRRLLGFVPHFVPLGLLALLHELL